MFVTIGIIRILFTFLFFGLLLNGCGISKIQEKDSNSLNRQLAVLIEPSVEIVNDTTIVFKANAIRQYELGNEILPSSEEFRVEVMAINKITMLWSSYHNNEFLQKVQKVQPQKLGESKLFEMTWNRKNSKGIRIEDEEVWVRLMIPCMPDFYFESFLVKLPKLSK